MARLVFLFTSWGNAGYESGIAWDPTTPTKNHLAVGPGGLLSEGYFFLLKRLKEEMVFDEITIIIESNRSPGFCTYQTKKGKINCYVVPDISQARPYIKEGDIIWVRGGFRNWHSFLMEYKTKNWLLLYAADTGRERWLFWDVIFDDFNNRYFLDKRKRFWFPFRKPINEKIFKPLNLESKYDVCIGASHIHDKKAQWKMIEVAKEYKKLFDKDLHCVLPGAARRGVKSNQIHSEIMNHNLKVDVTGLLSRLELCTIYNQSKLFVYLGHSGQNDRGPLEALRCGTPIIIASYKRHAFFFNQATSVVKCVRDSENFENIARLIHLLLNPKELIPIEHPYMSSMATREFTTEFFEIHSGMESIILPEMKRLFNVLKNNKPDSNLLVKEYMA